MVSACLRTNHGVLPTNVDVGQLQGAFNQIGFAVVLLQIDKGWALIPAFWQQIEPVHLLIAQEHLTDVPGHAFLHHLVTNTQAVPYLERALSKTQSARTNG